LISPAGAAARRQVIPPVHLAAGAAVAEVALHPVHRAEAADKMNVTCSINS